MKNAWSCTSTLPYVFLAWDLLKHRNNFAFTSKDQNAHLEKGVELIQLEE
jgi:hypothetical protein